MGTGNVEDIYELSPLQGGMLLHSMHDGAADMYLSQQTYTAEGPLDPDALVRAWESVVAAHPALRTSFHWAGLDKPLQVVHREVALPVVRDDWSEADPEQQRKQIDQMLAEDRSNGFDLAVAPLQRLHLIRLGPDRHHLTWTYHHLLLDGWSVPVFMDELLACYRVQIAGGPKPPAAPPFRDYIAWLQRHDPEATKSFWAQTLGGVAPSRLARLRPWDPRHGTGSVERRIVALPGPVGAGLREAAARHRVTFGTVVQAAWALVLRRLSGAGEEVTFGCASSGRPAELPRVDRMVGMFANTLPVRVAVPEDEDLGSWLRRIQDGYAQTRRYEYTPLSDVKKWAGAPGRQLFDSLLVLENYSLTVDAAGMPGQLEFRREALYDKISFPLTLTMTPEPTNELQVLIHRERFEPGFVDDVLGRLRAVFEAIATADRLAEAAAAAGPPVAAQPVRDSPGTAAAGDGSDAAPRTPLEERIAAAFREVLEADDVDATVSFFDLGGDSFAAVRAVGRIEGATIGMLAASPSVRELALALTADLPDGAETMLAEGFGIAAQDDVDEQIVQLERLLAARRAEKERQDTRIVPVPRDGSLVCSHQQEGVWFMNQFNPRSTVYHIPFAMRMRGDFDLAAWERALLALTARHEALRTRFVDDGGLPRQIIDPPPTAFGFTPVDLPADRVTAWAADLCDAPFDLAAGPVFRTAVARTAPDEHVVAMVLHHIVADGWSVRILAQEVTALYNDEIQGTRTPLPPLAVQPADHAAWERRMLAGPAREDGLAYWRRTLAGLPATAFPADRPRPAQPVHSGSTISRRLPEETTAAVREYVRTHRVSLLAVLQAALLTVLQRHTGQDDLAVGSIFSGRTRPELEPLVGYFGNTLVLRADVSGDPSFDELVRRCQAAIHGATEHQDVSFKLVAEALRPERVTGRNPLFQIGLTLLPQGIAGRRFALGDLTIEGIQVEERYALYDISVDVDDAPDGRLSVAVEYATELYDADRALQLMEHFVTALAGGLEAPQDPVGGIDILTDRERRVILGEDGQSTDTVHQMFEAVVARTPEIPAAVDADGTLWSYGQLDEAADELAERLVAQGVGRNTVVGVRLPRGPQQVTAFLAVWKAGGACLPLDARLGSEELTRIVSDAAPALIVARGADLASFADGSATPTLDPDAPYSGAGALPDGGATLDDLAFVLPVPGASGVAVSHRALRDQVLWSQDAYPVRVGERVLSLSEAGWEHFWPLAVGGIAVLAARDAADDPEGLRNLLAAEHVTTARLAPTTLAKLAAAPLPKTLRRVCCTGEPLSLALARRVLAARPDLELHFVHSCVEAFDVAAWRCGPGDLVVPLGRPVAGKRIRILDAQQRPVPIGVPGQLSVAGADDRWHVASEPVLRRGDGVLEYAGRRDADAVEQTLSDFPGVRQCAVIARPGFGVCGYVVGDFGPGSAESETVSSTGLLRHLAERLSGAVVPAGLVIVPDLPVTAGGQLNVERLPDPPPASAPVAPRTDTERWLADSWRELLDVGDIGVRDNLFELGGSSLTTTRLVARIRDGLALEMHPREVFANPTIELLAARLDEAREARGGEGG